MSTEHFPVIDEYNTPSRPESATPLRCHEGLKETEAITPLVPGIEHVIDPNKAISERQLKLGGLAVNAAVLAKMSFAGYSEVEIIKAKGGADGESEDFYLHFLEQDETLPLPGSKDNILSVIGRCGLGGERFSEFVSREHAGVRVARGSDGAEYVFVTDLGSTGETSLRHSDGGIRDIDIEAGDNGPALISGVAEKFSDNEARYINQPDRGFFAVFGGDGSGQGDEDAVRVARSVTKASETFPNIDAILRLDGNHAKKQIKLKMRYISESLERAELEGKASGSMVRVVENGGSKYVAWGTLDGSSHLFLYSPETDEVRSLGGDKEADFDRPQEGSGSKIGIEQLKSGDKIIISNMANELSLNELKNVAGQDMGCEALARQLVDQFGSGDESTALAIEVN